MDIAAQIGAVKRQVGDRSVVLRRGYVAEPEDVWGACTERERLNSWFLPVSGDLTVGGRYQLEDNAHGEILRCQAPRLLQVTWEFGQAPPSTVEVRLKAVKGGTMFELEHSGLDDEQQWDQFGPGAVGIGWDLVVLGLGVHLAGFKHPEGWESSDEYYKYLAASNDAWRAAYEAAGAQPNVAAAAAERTLAAYTPSR
ncbi:SRPBCC family protein [Amycolatopsis sacchari]|uniref:SRPBCC family protein n=1 Tax=Amycolatopsis sacchari TaxID=115433 RepID=UPI003D73FF61